MPGRVSVFSPYYLKHAWELIPLVTCVGVAVVGASAYVGYALATKSDVRIRKSSELPPFERVDPTKPQKLVTITQKYKPIPELEALKKEIGSYRS